MDDSMDLDHAPTGSGISKTTTEHPQIREELKNNDNNYEANSTSSTATMSQDSISLRKSMYSDSSKKPSFKDISDESVSSLFENIQVMDSAELKKKMASMAGKRSSFNVRTRNAYPRNESAKTEVREELTNKTVADPVKTPPPLAKERHDSLALPFGTNIVNFDVESFCRDLGFMEDLSTRMGKVPLVSLFERKDWGASPPLSTEDVRHPVYYVNFTDTGVGTSPCHGEEECLARVKGLQRFHMETLGLPDIKYNWLIGSDGCVYEGRGWKHDGYRPPEIKFGIKGNCMHIAYIGDFSVNGPPTRIIIIGYSLVIEGFHKKFIAKEAKIISRDNAKSDLDKLFQKYKKTHEF